jgi:hypothetical protein
MTHNFKMYHFDKDFKISVYWVHHFKIVDKTYFTWSDITKVLELKSRLECINKIKNV